MRFIIMTIFLLVSSAAFAETGKMKAETVLDILSGLLQLDGYDKVVKDGANEKTVKVLFQFGGGLRMLNARNIEKARPVAKQYQDSIATLRASLLKDGKLPEDRAVEYLVEEKKIKDTLIDIEFSSFKEDELRLNENNIPSNTISLILPLIK